MSSRGKSILLFSLLLVVAVTVIFVRNLSHMGTGEGRERAIRPLPPSGLPETSLEDAKQVVDEKLPSVPSSSSAFEKEAKTQADSMMGPAMAQMGERASEAQIRTQRSAAMLPPENYERLPCPDVVDIWNFLVTTDGVRFFETADGLFRQDPSVDKFIKLLPNFVDFPENPGTRFSWGIGSVLDEKRQSLYSAVIAYEASENGDPVKSRFIVALNYTTGEVRKLKTLEKDMRTQLLGVVDDNLVFVSRSAPAPAQIGFVALEGGAHGTEPAAFQIADMDYQRNAGQFHFDSVHKRLLFLRITTNGDTQGTEIVGINLFGNRNSKVLFRSVDRHVYRYCLSEDGNLLTMLLTPIYKVKEGPKGSVGILGEKNIQAMDSPDKFTRLQEVDFSWMSFGQVMRREGNRLIVSGGVNYPSMFRLPEDKPLTIGGKVYKNLEHGLVCVPLSR
jgi:hypothetical protein